MARCPAGHESEASDYCDTCGLVIGGEAPASTPVPSAVRAGATPTAAAPAAGSGGAGCPVCQAERNGRFCEECGYDFELAEAMPQLPTPEPEIAVTLKAPIEQPVAQAGNGSGAGSAAESEPASTSTAEQGLDLDAELARAEAEAAQAESASSSVGEPVSTSEAVEPEYSAPVSTASVLSPSTGSSFELTLVVDADRDYYKAQVERGDIVESEFPFPKYPHERRFTFTESPVRIGRASASRGLNPEIDLTGPPLDPAVSHLHAQLLRHEEGWVVVDLDSANGTRLNDAEEPLAAETEIPVKQGDRVHLGVWTTITIQ